jgi:hypothetical protein
MGIPTTCKNSSEQTLKRNPTAALNVQNLLPRKNTFRNILEFMVLKNSINAPSVQNLLH